MPDKKPPTALEADAQFTRLRVWALPTDPAGFRAWLKKAGVTEEDFLRSPAAEAMPDSLRKAL